MRVYDNNLVGKSFHNTTMLWCDSDSVSRFIENKKKFGENWYYYDNKIEYTYNASGHRCKNIDDIDLDNYILTIGCSNTEGIGVHLEDSYPFILANLLNCDYYNLGLGGCGLDLVLHNLVVWFSTVERLPKYVVIQGPSKTRVATGDVNNLRPRGLWDDNPDMLKFIDTGNSTGFFEARAELFNYTVDSLIKVPKVFLTLRGVSPLNDSCILINQLDNARDNQHPGRMTHLHIAKTVRDRLINTECLNFYQKANPRS